MQQIHDIQKLKTIAISEQNYQKLKSLGEFGDSYNDILSRLLEQKKENVV